MNFSREQIEAASTPEELQALLSAVGPSSKWTVSTLGDVADFFGIAVSTTKGWSQEGMPGTDAGWNLAEIVRWRIDRLKNSDLATAKKEQDLELGQVVLESKRLELAKERGELLDRGDVERWAAMALIAARETIMSLVESLAVSAPPEMRDFVRAETDRHCRAVLIALQRRLESDELDKETNSGSVAADGNDGAPPPERMESAQ